MRSGMRRAGWETRALAALLFAHVVLGVYYSVTIPIWEAHDEIGHYSVARYVARERRLPRPGQKLIAQNDESRQPPLYYLLAALPVSLVRVEDELEPHINPHMHWPEAQGGHNRAIHDAAAERWPYRGTVLAVHVARWVSVALGALGLLFTFLAAGQAFPDQPWIRWGAALTLCFWPQYRFTTAVVNNDIMVTTVSAALTWLLVRAVAAEKPVAADLVALGGVMGLALFSKNSALALLPVVALVLLRSVIRARPATRTGLLLGLLGGAVLGLAIVGWWYTRNVRGGTGMFGGYSLSMAARILVHTVSGRSLWQYRLVPPALQAGLFSLWAAFGWNNVGLPLPTYWLAAAWAVFALIGLLLKCRRFERPRALAIAALSLVVASTLGTWLLFAIAGGRTDLPGRYLLPALPALCVLLSAGWATLLPEPARRATWVALAGGLALLAILTPVLYIQPVYALPRLPSAAEASAYTPADLTFGDFAQLVGYQIEGQAVEPGGAIRVALLWRVLGQTPVDYTLAIQVFEPERHLVGEVHRYPGAGALATTTWQPGQLFAEEAEVRIDRSGGEGRLAWIEVSFFDRENVGVPIDVRDADGRLAGYAARLGRVKVRGTSLAAPATALEGIRFGPAIRLATVRANTHLWSVEPRIDLDLYWAAVGRPDRDYTVSIQLRNAQNSIVSQLDRQPQDGDYPTSYWEPGEMVSDRCQLSVPAHLPAGTYTLYACVYDLPTLQRLPAAGPHGEPLPAGEAALFSLIVASGGEMELRPLYPLIQAEEIPLGIGQGS